ncbi:MAG: toxin-antitoxin system HicB family antitoxin [Clostridia bacterium]|nr:toxin-antitoxin system HicB family antitoxin [Clostridia bacterium]
MNNGSQKAKDKYLKEKVDSFILRVPKGEKAKIQERAAELGKSLNAYIVELIREDMESGDKKEQKVVSKVRSALPSFLD